MTTHVNDDHDTAWERTKGGTLAAGPAPTTRRSTALRAIVVVVALVASIVAVALWVTGIRGATPTLDGALAARAANGLAQEARIAPTSPGDAASRAATGLARQYRSPLPVTSGDDAAAAGNAIARAR